MYVTIVYQGLAKPNTPICRWSYICRRTPSHWGKRCPRLSLRITGSRLGPPDGWINRCLALFTWIRSLRLRLQRSPRDPYFIKYSFLYYYYFVIIINININVKNINSFYGWRTDPQEKEPRPRNTQLTNKQTHQTLK